MLIWTIVAVLVFLGLVAYAVVLHRAVKKRKLQQQEWHAELQDYVEERRSNIHSSIVIIAKAMLAGQIGVSECCIRLSNLLNRLGDVSHQERFMILHTVADEVAHIPIKEEWKALKFKQRMAHLQEMSAIELKHKDFVLDSCKTIGKLGIDSAANAGPVASGAVEIYSP